MKGKPKIKKRTPNKAPDATKSKDQWIERLVYIAMLLLVLVGLMVGFRFLKMMH